MFKLPRHTFNQTREENAADAERFTGGVFHRIFSERNSSNLISIVDQAVLVSFSLGSLSVFNAQFS
jgi:hypothetical protein